LPKIHKLDPPKYQAISNNEVKKSVSEGWEAKVIAGKILDTEGSALTQTPILYAHISIAPKKTAEFEIDSLLTNAGIYVFKGTALAGPEETKINSQELGVLDKEAGRIQIQNPSKNSYTELLVMAGKPLNEPIARSGPFVMTTKSELRQAYEDFSEGKMGNISPSGNRKS